MEQNKSMTEKIDKLETENAEMKKNSASKQERVAANMKELVDLNKAGIDIMKEMKVVKDKLADDDQTEFTDIDWFFEDDVFEQIAGRPGSQRRLNIKVERVDNTHELAEPFTNAGREERIDVYFGQDSDYTAKSLRRFIERFTVVRKLNIAAKLTGWDKPEYRADKLKLALQGDAFDFVSFESSMLKQWTKNDDDIILKLKDRFINIQAVELNILKFEKSCQEQKELLNEYLARLRQLVKDAYDGDSQAELDRKVAWKFVSGVQDDKIRRKLMEDGWMQNRRESKSLEEILKVAEVTKRTDEAVRATGSNNNISMVGETDQINAARFKRSSNESSNSGRSSGEMSNSSGLALDFIMCWYCNREHRGGWFYCSKRKKENPSWRPERRLYQPGSKKPVRRGRSNDSNPNRSKQSNKTDFQ